MKRILMLTAVSLIVLVLCSCGLQDEYTEMGFGSEAVGSAELASPMHVERHLAAAVGGDGSLVEEALIYTGNVSCVQNGIRVTAVQAVADRHNMYILLKVNTKKDIKFTFEDRFETVTFGVRNAWTGSDMCWNSVSKDGVMYIVFGMDSEEGLKSGTVDISLKNLINCNGEGTVYHGNWNLEFDFAVADVTKSFSADKTFHHNGVDLKIRQLDVSPFSAYIECGLAEGSAKPDEDWSLYEGEIDIIMENGDTVGVSFEGGGSSYEDNWKNFSCYRHGKLMNIINPDEIKAVIINGKKIELK